MVQEGQGLAEAVQDDERLWSKAGNTGIVFKRHNIYIGEIPPRENQERRLFGLILENGRIAGRKEREEKQCSFSLSGLREMGKIRQAVLLLLGGQEALHYVDF